MVQNLQLNYYINYTTMKLIGWILVVVGVLMIILRGVNFTTTKKVVDAGPIEINKKENHTLEWPLYTGGILAVVGVVLVVADRRRSA